MLPIRQLAVNLQTVVWAVRQAAPRRRGIRRNWRLQGHTTLFVAEYVEFQAWENALVSLRYLEGIPTINSIRAGRESNKAT